MAGREVEVKDKRHTLCVEVCSMYWVCLSVDGTEREEECVQRRVIFLLAAVDLVLLIGF